MPVDLILVPTPLERNHLEASLSDTSQLTIRCCGFGVVASGIMAQHWLAELRPRRVILVGVAGSYSDDITTGTAATFTDVNLEGVGVQQGDTVIPPEQIGFPQFQGEVNGSSFAIRDTLSLAPAWEPQSQAGLLTVCAASDALDIADARSNQYGGVIAEDMESYSVAVACLLHQLPLTVIRGISNRAGIRDKATWQIKSAMHAAAQALQTWLETER